MCLKLQNKTQQNKIYTEIRDSRNVISFLIQERSSNLKRKYKIKTNIEEQIRIKEKIK